MEIETEVDRSTGTLVFGRKGVEDTRKNRLLGLIRRHKHVRPKLRLVYASEFHKERNEDVTGGMAE